MSVPCLLHDGKVIEIADELESFLHVLIYDASRFVSHNLTPIQTHMLYRTYFDGHAVAADGSQQCSSEKLVAIKHAQLCVSDVPVVFGHDESHPLNTLLSELFALFQSRFAVYQWLSRHPLTESVPPVAPPKQAVDEDMDDMVDDMKMEDTFRHHPSSYRPC